MPNEAEIPANITAQTTRLECLSVFIADSPNWLVFERCVSPSLMRNYVDDHSATRDEIGHFCGNQATQRTVPRAVAELQELATLEVRSRMRLGRQSRRAYADRLARYDDKCGLLLASSRLKSKCSRLNSRWSAGCIVLRCRKLPQIRAPWVTPSAVGRLIFAYRGAA